MKKPDFLIVGAAKSGTTSLYGYLKQHPEIFMPEIKECRYFSGIGNKNMNPFSGMAHARVVSDSREYYRLFQNARKRMAGEASPDYLYYHETSVKNILDELGKGTKIIIMLRNPVDRAFSNYCHILKEGFDQMTFAALLEKEEDWKRSGVWYGFFCQDPGRYFLAVKNYLENFEAVKVIKFEDFVKDPASSMRDVCEFLDIDPSFRFREPAFQNSTALPKNKFLHSLLTKPGPVKTAVKRIAVTFLPEKKIQSRLKALASKNMAKPHFEEQMKERLRVEYMADMERLERIVKIKISDWKE